jgi:hypothetical protein
MFAAATPPELPPIFGFRGLINNFMSTIIEQIKRWFTLKEAAEYSSIGKHRLVALARIGKIRGSRDMDSGRHDWIFDRLSIDAYREAQMPSLMDAKQKAIAILKDVSV